MEAGLLLRAIATPRPGATGIEALSGIAVDLSDLLA